MISDVKPAGVAYLRRTGSFSFKRLIYGRQVTVVRQCGHEQLARIEVPVNKRRKAVSDARRDAFSSTVTCRWQELRGVRQI